MCQRAATDSDALLSARLCRALGFARLPHRAAIGRRLMGLVAEAEQQIAALGHEVVTEVKPPASHSEVSALDGRMYEVRGPEVAQERPRKRADSPLFTQC